MARISGIDLQYEPFLTAPPLTLSLLMLGVFANNHDFALALNDFALLAHGFNGRSYFHTVEPPYEKNL